MFNTRITRMLNIRTPVIAAPATGVSGGLLVAKVINAGGFAFLPAGYIGLDNIKEQYSIAQSELTVPSQNSVSPIGMGFLGWILDLPNSADIASLDFALEQRPKAIWLSFGNDIYRWVKYIRDHDEKKGNNPKTLIFVQINSVEEARIASFDWKVDAIVAQGIEAGGHGSATAPPLNTLIPAIRSALGNNCPPLLGAGGIVVGSQVASILTLGADGVVLGTRFSASQESLYSPARKEALLKADLTATVRSLAFDYAPNILGWPDYINGRALNNEIAQFFKEGDPKSVEIIQAKFDEGVKNEDANKLVIWAGTSVGLINEIKSAEDIVEELHRDALTALKAAQTVI